MNKVVSWLVKREVILLLVGLAFFLRLPSLFEPYWYGDEGIYLTIGQAMNKGVELYKEIHDNKPPLLYVVAAAVGGVEFWFKFVLLVWNLVTVVVFWEVAKKVIGSKNKTVIATLVFILLTSIPLIEGNIANAEIFFILLTLTAFGMLFKKDNFKICLLAGVVYGIAALFKVPAILDAAIWPIIWFFYKEKDWFKKIIWLSIGIAIPTGLAAIYFLSRGTIAEFLTAAGFKLIPYLSSWKVNIPLVGNLWGRAILLLAGTVLMWKLKHKFSKITVLLSLWVVFGLFAALLSGRPYPHYLLQVVPAIILLVLSWKKEVGEMLLRIGTISVVGLAVISFGFYGYHDWEYYQNFASWVVKQKNYDQYLTWFGPQVVDNYKIAKLLKTESDLQDKVFVWGDEPVIYALSKRLPATKYIVKYHIEEFGAQQETLVELKNTNPKYIIDFGDEEKLPGLTTFLQKNYALEKNIGKSQVYRIIEAWNKL